MKSIPHPVFGKVVFLCSAEAGEVRTLALNESGSYEGGIYFYTRGEAEGKVLDTGEKIPTRRPGWLNTENMNLAASTGGKLEITYPLDTEWVCIPNGSNVELPVVESISLGTDQKMVLIPGDNIFVARGCMVINGREWVAPARIRVQSTSVQAVAKGRTFALRFK